MKKLIILGGGYGGVNILMNMLDHNFPEDTEIILVDRNPYHCLKTEFYAVAAGTGAPRDVRIDFPKDKRVAYVFGEVTKVDTENKQILFEDPEQTIVYDYLVVGLGCEDAYHDIEGAEKFTHSIQTISGARRIGNSVGNAKAYGNVTIVGAGLSGIEVAAEIRESRPDLNIRLLDRGPRVLRGFDPKISDYVEEWFIKNNIDIIHNSKVEYVDEAGICDNGKCLLSDVTIWTAGVRPNKIIRELTYEKDKLGRVVVNDFFQVPTDPNVYIVGDCATSEYSPSAQLARQQGEQIAEVLLAIINGKEPKKPRPIKLKGTLGSLGKSEGFGSMMQKSVTGRFARLAKSGVLWLSKRH